MRYFSSLYGAVKRFPSTVSGFFKTVNDPLDYLVVGFALTLGVLIVLSAIF